MAFQANSASWRSVVAKRNEVSFSTLGTFEPFARRFDFEPGVHVDLNSEHQTRLHHCIRQKPVLLGMWLRQQWARLRSAPTRDGP